MTDDLSRDRHWNLLMRSLRKMTARIWEDTIRMPRYITFSQ